MKDVTFPHFLKFWYVEVIEHTHSGGSIKFVLIFFFKFREKRST